jgi:urease accessory protein
VRVGLFHEALGQGAQRRASAEGCGSEVEARGSAPEPGHDTAAGVDRASDERSGSGHASGWRAALALELELRGARTVLARAQHVGPLRVQRAFYPEGDEVCHLYVLHPPGGIASTDSLETDVRVGAGAHALLTTPGAGKLYRSRGLFAEVRQRLSVAAGGRLEWFPQEMIAFSGAEARLSTRIELSADAVYAGWEIMCLGRPACAERFSRGHIVNELSLYVDGVLRFMERADFAGDDAVLSEAWGLAGAPVLGTFLLAHPNLRTGQGASCLDDAWLEETRAAVTAREGLFALTSVSGLLVGRYLGHSTLDARACFEHMFATLRPHYAGRVATPPRIWRT